MANKHIKRWLTIFVTRKLQIKTIVKYHCRSIRMANNWNTDTKCWWDCEALGTLIHCWWVCKIIQLVWETVWQFLTKLYIHLLYSPKERKWLIFNIKTCTQMLTAALFHNHQNLEVMKMFFSWPWWWWWFHTSESVLRTSHCVPFFQHWHKTSYELQMWYISHI